MAVKYLVTGATGFVGANLTRALLAIGGRVTIFTRRSSNKWRLNDVMTDLEDFVLDLEDFDRVKIIIKKIKPDVIFHLATANLYQGKHLPLDLLLRTNLNGTINLLTACDQIDYSAFINTGSSSEYGKKLSSMKESDICVPDTTYGVSKCAVTLYCQYLARVKRKPIINLRLFSPYGQYNDQFRLITYILLELIRNKKAKLADPSSVRDYIHVDDVIALYLEAAKKADKCYGEIFNVGSGREYSVADVVRIGKKASGKNLKVIWGAEAKRDFDAVHWRADMTKTFRSFRWRPKYSLEEGIKNNYHWLENNLALYTGRN